MVNDELIRDALNKLQEKDQRLMDAYEKLSSSQEEMQDSLHKIEVQRDQLAVILQEMGEGLLVIDADRNIELANAHALRILGYDRLEDIPTGYQKFFVLQLWKEMMSSAKDVVRRDIHLQRPREITLAISVSKLKSSGGAVVVLRDVTEQRRVERMKSDFVANVAHEIRSPMAPMKDAVGLVLDETTGPLNENQKKFLNIVDKNIDRLTRLINDLLDLSKIEAGRLDLKKKLISMEDLISGAVDVLQIYADRKGIQFTTSYDKQLPRFSGDRDRILQVIINLVTNALKFTPKGGTVSVDVKEVGTDPKTHALKFTISDTGPGILPEDANIIFDRFKQLESTEKTNGTGLGLAISKSIIEMHGGQIWVESEMGSGARFIFTIPVATTKGE